MPLYRIKETTNLSEDLHYNLLTREFRTLTQLTEGVS